MFFLPIVVILDVIISEGLQRGC